MLIINSSLEVALFTAVFLRIDKKFDFTCKKIFLFQTVFFKLVSVYSYDSDHCKVWKLTLLACIVAQNRQRTRLFLQSSELGHPTLSLQASVSPPPLVLRGYTIAYHYERGGGGGSIFRRGYRHWLFSCYPYTHDSFRVFSEYTVRRSSVGYGVAK